MYLFRMHPCCEILKKVKGAADSVSLGLKSGPEISICKLLTQTLMKT